MNLLNEWILRLLNEETPQAIGGLEKNGCFCCLGDLINLASEGLFDVRRIDQIGSGKYISYTYKGKYLDPYMLPDYFTENVLADYFSDKVRVISEGTLSMRREYQYLHPAELNDARVPKSVIGLFTWGFVTEYKLSEEIRELCFEYIDPEQGDLRASYLMSEDRCDPSFANDPKITEYINKLKLRLEKELNE